MSRADHPASPIRLTFVALAGLVLVAGGCARFAPLEADEIDSISLRLGGGGDAVCVEDPRSHVVVDLIHKGGKRLETWNGEGSRSGKVSLRELDVAADGVSVDEVGRIRFPRDRLAALDRRVTIRARLRDRPIDAAIVLTPRFDCGGLADYSGAPGAAGSTSSGGAPGEAGPALHVALGRIDTRLNGRLLVARVTRPGAPPAYHLVATRGPAARLTVSAAGGDGGDGGHGDDGMKGTDGERGYPGDRCENGGDGGDGGNGQPGGSGDDGGGAGDGGNGGSFVIEYAPGSAVLVDQLAFRVDGGAGGAGGDGGDGGEGGAGGRGGQGGDAGSREDNKGRVCQTGRGRSGNDGLEGPRGASGSDGSDGRPGARGSVQARAVDPSVLWARELGEGAAIVIDPLEH